MDDSIGGTVESQTYSPMATDVARSTVYIQNLETPNAPRGKKFKHKRDKKSIDVKDTLEDSSRVLNITIEKNGILEYGDVT